MAALSTTLQSSYVVTFLALCCNLSGILFLEVTLGVFYDRNNSIITDVSFLFNFFELHIMVYGHHLMLVESLGFGVTRSLKLRKLDSNGSLVLVAISKACN